MRQQDMFKTTGKRRGLWERLVDGLRGARTGYLLGPTHLHDATNTPQSIPIPQPTTEMAQRAFSRFGVDPGVSREELVELVTNGLDGTWHCMRVWEAWHVGTMSSQDFYAVVDSETPEDLADLILGASRANGWKTIDTVPVASTDYFFCELTWGPESDAATGQGFRWRGEWYAVGVFHVLHSDASKPRFEYRMVKVVPTHWRPEFSTPYEEAVE